MIKALSSPRKSSSSRRLDRLLDEALPIVNFSEDYASSPLGAINLDGGDKDGEIDSAFFQGLQDLGPIDPHAPLMAVNLMIALGSLVIVDFKARVVKTTLPVVITLDPREEHVNIHAVAFKSSNRGEGNVPESQTEVRPF